MASSYAYRRKTRKGLWDSAYGTAAIDIKIERELGRKIREAYSSVLEEPVPQRFIDLLEKLDADFEDSEK